MEALPREIVRVLRVFEDVFSERVWDWVQVLVVGAILTPGQRTVAAVLRVMGLSDERQFQNYHRVLNRARWSSRELSRRLLVMLVETFVPAEEPVVIGMDETIERRRGAKIAAKGIYRDPVRSSKSHFVKASGLRWISMQVLAEVPWARRTWGLPFLTVLAPSERYNLERGCRHKTLPQWGRQMIRQIRRWLPELAGVPPAKLASPWTLSPAEQRASGCVLGRDYPAPIVDQATALRQARDRLYALRGTAAARHEADAIQQRHGSRRSGLPPSGGRARRTAVAASVQATLFGDA